MNSTWELKEKSTGVLKVTVDGDAWKKAQDKAYQILKDENLCLIFEVIDPVNDPHIIEYDEANIVLLAAIKRTIKFEELSYNELVDYFVNFAFDIKIAGAFTLDTFDAMIKLIDETKNDFKTPIEGYVLEDANKYMFKVKGGYYNRWKHLRQVKETLSRGRPLKMGWAQTPEENYFVDWCKRQDRITLETNSIIQLRKMFLNEMNHLFTLN